MSDAQGSAGSGTPPIAIKRRSHAEQIADKCIHFNGLSNDRCDAGVAYESVRVLHDAIQYRREPSQFAYTQTASRPCHVSMNLGGATCEKRCAPTAEYVAERVATAQRDITAMFAARALIVKATDGARGVSGTIDCPTCAKPLHYFVAGSNGHIHARCETQGCIAWME